MERQMFCFQCEQTAGGHGCTGAAGVCGKTAETAKLQDQLTGALIGLAVSTKDREKSIPRDVDRLVMEALFTTVTNVDFEPNAVRDMIERIHYEKNRLCGSGDSCPDYDMQNLWDEENRDVRSLKALLLFGLRGMAAYAYHAAVLGYEDEEVNRFLYEALRVLASAVSVDVLLTEVLETGRVNYKCMELLERANTETFGIPAPTMVPLTVERGPFIVVTGHDLLEMKRILKETEGTEIKVYTHGEMLPAHAYPELRKYPQLRGNYGTAWQNQQSEFDGLPAPVLFTTNCIMPPRSSYRDRIYTTGPVQYPGTMHLDAGSSFQPLLRKARDLGGYPETVHMVGINGGSVVRTGWSYRTVLEYRNELRSAIESGEIRHIFLVGGCDGARPGRNYYTQFVKQTPKNTLILTLACGKFRFNDLDLGSVAGIPRLLDLGQCNDAYGAIQLFSALAELFHCDINDLPLSMVLSWYEQKAVCILLTLLYLGVKNILLGPTLPACLSENILVILKEKFNLGIITTPEADLKRLLDREI